MAEADPKDLAIFAEKMRSDRLPEIATHAFLRAAKFVLEGGATTIPDADLEPMDPPRTLAEIADYESAGREAISRAAVIKLNGGLGTGMGLSKAKSLLPVRPGLSFLDSISKQVLSLIHI